MRANKQTLLEELWDQFTSDPQQPINKCKSSQLERRGNRKCRREENGWGEIWTHQLYSRSQSLQDPVSFLCLFLFKTHMQGQMSAAHHHSNKSHALSSAHTWTTECVRDVLLIEPLIEDTCCPVPYNSLILAL